MTALSTVVLQFTDIPRPGISIEYFESLRREVRYVLMIFFGEFLQKMVRQEWNVFFPFPQGREGDCYHIESVKEVLPEFPAFDEGLQG